MSRYQDLTERGDMGAGSKRLPILANSANSYLSHEFATQPQRQPLVATRPLHTCEVCVIVPVRNEAATLEGTLAALAQQVDVSGQPLSHQRYEVILLANNCTDASAAIAHHFARRHPTLQLHVVERTLPPAEAYIGRVRQLLMDAAYDRFRWLGRSWGVIASTDGDSQVSPTWIAANLSEIQQGADAVGGRILTDRLGRALLEPYTRACHLREVGYRSLIAELESYLDPNPHDPWPRHFQHFGASFAVTADWYAKAGGMPPVRTPEDVAFYRALLRVDARFRHSPCVKVTTSARQTGRTEMGLANQLKEWTKMGQNRPPFWVESVPAIVTRLQARRQLRSLWQRLQHGHAPLAKEIISLSSLLGLSGRWLPPVLQQTATFGELWERVEIQQQLDGNWADRWPKVAIEEAIADLRLRLSQLRQLQPPTPGLGLPDVAALPKFSHRLTA